jgi:hypothetical protein
LKIIAAHPRCREIQRAGLLKQLSDSGYQRIVIGYWKKNKNDVEADVGASAETTRALTGLRRFREARQLMAGWRERRGIAMWIVANYVICCSGVSSRQLKEVRSSCRDALVGLSHDHCARFLAYRLAEACALLDDRDGFRETWNRYRSYFDGKLEENEFFEAKRRYLMADLPTLARLLEGNEIRQYRKEVRALWWERLKLRVPKLNRRINIRWWWLILALWLLLRLLRDSS